MVKEKYPFVEVYQSKENVGQVCLRNKGFRDAKGSYVICLDDDCYFDDPEVVAQVVEVLERHPRVAVVALPYYEPKTEQMYFSNERPGTSGSFLSVGNFGAGAAVFRKDPVMEIGGYCEKYFFAVEEDDLAIRLMDAGWDIISVPVTPLIHLYSGIRNLERLHILGPKNSILFIFLNAPLPHLISKLITTTLGLLWHGLTIGEVRLKILGIIQGYGLCLKYRKNREPVSIRTWEKFRRLIKQPEPYASTPSN